MPARSWRFHTLRLLLVGTLVWAGGSLIGYPLYTTAVAASIYLVWHIVNLWRLHRWLRNPQQLIPESFGLWADIFDSINSLEKGNLRQKEQYRTMIGEFRSLTDAFPDATLAIDKNNVITWFNNAAVRLLDLKNPDDLGKPVTNLLRGPDFANWLAVQEKVKSPLEMASPRGDRRWLTVNAVVFREDQRLIILRDSTDVHNVEKIRRDFVANISHELRTPLTVLQGYLEMLEDHPSDDVSDAISRMLSQTSNMQHLLDDLLELSRLQNVEIRGNKERVNIPALLSQLKEQAEELSKGRHEITFEIDRELWVNGVTVDLESAFSNLIANSIKYTPKGGTISVSWKSGPQGPLFRVMDNGIGIPRRDIPRLTERFYRVGSDRARSTGGSGLGLAIVKHVMNAHQAELSIESELGEGSVFTCTFPLESERSATVDL